MCFKLPQKDCCRTATKARHAGSSFVRIILKPPSHLVLLFCYVSICSQNYSLRRKAKNGKRSDENQTGAGTPVEYIPSQFFV